MQITARAGFFAIQTQKKAQNVVRLSSHLLASSHQSLKIVYGGQLEHLNGILENIRHVSNRNNCSLVW